MEITELQKQIVDGALTGTYVFTGPEGAVQKVYLDKMVSSAGMSIVRADSVAAAIKAMTQRSLTPEKHIYVVFDDIAFTKAEKAWETAFTRAESTPHLLVLQYSKLDGRLKFSKRNKDRICVFDTLGPEIAVKYVKKEIPELHTDVAEMLAEACGYDYGRIITECDKVRKYHRSKWRTDFDSAPEGTYEDEIDDSALELLEKGVIHKPVGDITFKLTDGILYRIPDDTRQYLALAIQKGEPALVVLTVLYNSFRAMLLVQGLGVDSSNAAKRTGLTPFQVKLAKEQMGQYSLSEIQTNLRRLQQIEYGIKTGTVDADTALEFAAVSCLVAK